jgi:hypothetical protein
MGRTIPNLSGDISAALLVSKFEGVLEPCKIIL